MQFLAKNKVEHGDVIEIKLAGPGRAASDPLARKILQKIAAWENAFATYLTVYDGSHILRGNI